MLFTSGSTGRPKGVAVEHGNLVHYVRGVARRLGLPAGSRYAHVSSFSADLGNTVLFPPLCLGGTLHVIPEDLVTDPEGLGAYFVEHRIDCLKIVPSHLSALLSGAHPERVIPRQLLVLGGEASSWELVERVHRLAPGLRILNHYGPTETTVGVVTHAVDVEARPEGAPTVPLGRPLPGAQIYLLDPTMRPAPIGAVGEVFVGGAGVARGYLGQPELTKERFVPDPFRGVAGARLYRTGDRARFLLDGTLVFLGRDDLQVKVRGHRVELGEIEAAIRGCPGVKDAAVIARGEGLAAYVVPAGPAPAGDARAFLEARLPAYMVPSSLVTLDALPLTANGKVDRRALAAIDHERDEAEIPVAPRTPAEEVLAGIWADVFGGRARVGVHDRFGDLGGHSLLAVQIIARARAAFGVEVPLRAIFDAPTVAGLADRVEAAVRTGVPPPPLARVSRDAPLPLSFAQERLWFLDQLDPGNPAYNLPTYLHLSGPLDEAALARAIHEIVRRHEVLRTTFATARGEPVQVVHATLDLAIVPEALGDRSAGGGRRRRDGEALRSRPRPPRARAPLPRRARGGAAPRDPPPHRHRRVGQGRLLPRALRALRGLPRRASLAAPGSARPVRGLRRVAARMARGRDARPADRLLEDSARRRARRDRSAHRPAAPARLHHPRRAPSLRDREGLSAALRALARREGATRFMTLLAAFYALCHRHGAGDDLVVGAVIAGRSRPEIEPLLGFFVNTLAIRATLSADLPFVDLVARTREACLGAYAHQDVPFERLVTDLAPGRDLSRTPIFQVLFTLEDGAPDPPRLPGLAVSAVAAEATTSKFDLTMSLRDGPDGLLGSLEHSTDLFDADTVDRMIERYRTLLDSIAHAPATLPDRRSRDLAGGRAAGDRLCVETCSRPARFSPRAAACTRLFEEACRSIADAGQRSP